MSDRTARTELGRKLLEVRAKLKADGVPMLTADEISAEMARRCCGLEQQAAAQQMRGEVKGWPCLVCGDAVPDDQEELLCKSCWVAGWAKRGVTRT